MSACAMGSSSCKPSRQQECDHKSTHQIIVTSVDFNTAINDAIQATNDDVVTYDDWRTTFSEAIRSRFSQLEGTAESCKTQLRIRHVIFIAELTPFLRRWYGRPITIQIVAHMIEKYQEELDIHSDDGSKVDWVDEAHLMFFGP